MKAKTTKNIIPILLVVVSLGLVFVFKWNWFSVNDTDLYDRDIAIPVDYGRIQGSLYEANSGSPGQEVLTGYNDKVVDVYAAISDNGKEEPVNKQPAIDDYRYGELAYQTKSYYDGVYQVDVMPGVYFVQIFGESVQPKSRCLIQVIEGETVQCDLDVGLLD